ncbi:MAG: hypothetical protein V4643_02925 [Bacteroidota bacterium]
MKLFTYIFGALFSIITVVGYLFKIMHWVGADYLLVAGLSGIAFIFIPSFFIYKYRKNN